MAVRVWRCTPLAPRKRHRSPFDFLMEKAPSQCIVRRQRPMRHFWIGILTFFCCLSFEARCAEPATRVELLMGKGTSMPGGTRRVEVVLNSA